MSSVTVSNTLAQRSLSSFPNDKYQTLPNSKSWQMTISKAAKMVENR